ncbi:MAG: choice-of-anchor J domain-containing protein, partial [Bacteroidales bacterium]|nr:choice-of-anchor J domain-containing protein [Bacteroidales bacterium]
MKRLLFFLMAIVFAIQGWTQTVPITIGTGTTTSSLSALPGLYGYNISANLYHSSEIGVSAGGDIESLEYNISSITAGTSARRLKIYLVEVTDDTLDLNQSWTALTSTATLVYDSTSFYAPTSGWKEFVFTSPFSYSGSGNLLILTEGYGCSASGSCSMTIYNSAGTASICFNRYKDTSPLSFTTNLALLTEGSGNTDKRPNIILNISPLGDYCYPPTQLAVDNITTNSADFTWTTHSTGSSWTVQYKPASDDTWSTEDVVYIGSYSLPNLTPNTLYDFRVKSYCATSESAVSTISFRTACDLISTLPFNESFDTYGTDAFLTCWSKISSNTNPSLNSTNYSSPKSMYLYTASGAHNYLITPEFDASIPINSLSANFYLRKSTLAYNITVGVMSDPSDTTTFDSLINLTPTAINSWQVFNVDFIDYTGTGQYIAFKVQGYGAANGMYLDDLIIYTTPSCAIPTGITRQNTTSNSFDLDWDNTDDANCIGWIIDYKEHDATVWQEEFVTYHPHTLTNLSPNTLYNIRLRAICSSGDTTLYTSILTYGMPCEPISIFPWEEGFEDSWWVGDGLGGTTDSRPWCWININGGASTSYKWQKTTTSSYVHSGTGAAQMYTANTTGLLGDWLITPAFSLTGNQRLLFWAKGYSTYTDNLTVKILDLTTNPTVSSAADTSLFVELMSNTVIPASDWTEYEINLSDFTGDFRFAFVRNTTGGYYLNIDDVSISDIPACARPTAINTGYVIDEEIELSWIPGNTGDAAWYLYWKAASATDYDSVYVTQQPYVLQNLTANTTYNIYLRTDCLTELSEATNPISIKTALCAPVTTFPYTEGFDSLGATAGAFPPCWERPIIYSDYPKTSTEAARVHSAPASLEIHSAVGSPTYAVTPPMGEDINTLRVTFWAMAESTTSSGTIEVGVMSDPNNLLTFESVQVIQPTNTSYNQYEVIFAGTTLNGLNKSIAFRQNTVSAIYYYWIDDVVVDYIPACSYPALVEVSNISTTSADVTWAPANATDNAWWLYYKTAAATSYDSIYITGTPSYSFTTLTANTLYDIYLRTDCGAELSEQTVVTSFRTSCGEITSLPFTENFDSYTTGTSVYIPCWERINTYSSDRPYIN